MIIFALGVRPDFEDDGTQQSATPPDCTELFRIVILLVNQIRLVKDLLRLFQADAVFPLYITIFIVLKVKARI